MPTERVNENDSEDGDSVATVCTVSVFLNVFHIDINHLTWTVKLLWTVPEPVMNCRTSRLFGTQGAFARNVSKTVNGVKLK